MSASGMAETLVPQHSQMIGGLPSVNRTRKGEDSRREAQSSARRALAAVCSCNRRVSLSATMACSVSDRSSNTPGGKDESVMIGKSLKPANSHPP